VRGRKEKAPDEGEMIDVLATLMGHGDPGEAMRVAKRDAIGKVLERRRHMAIHILRVGQTAQRPGLPFR
jgi:hypothetical protein